jgi:phosphatidate cytidylyltransferase
MLCWRLLVSAILVPSLIGLFYADQTTGRAASLLLIFCCLVAVRNSWELTDLLRVRNLNPSFPVTAALSLLVIASAWAHTRFAAGTQQPALASLGWITAAMTLGFLVLLAYQAWQYQEPGKSMESLGANLLTLMYAGVLLAVTAQLRWFPRHETGYFALASMIICVKSGDTFAYAFGRLWGRRKMAPKLSPGKTGMGLVGAIFGSLLGAWLWLTFAGPLFSAAPKAAALHVVLAYGFTVGMAGLIGDLCESLIKRDVQKKDSAALMPGFGGLLDLVDSPLFAGPVALAWWILMPPAL